MIERLRELRRTPASAAEWFAARREGGSSLALEQAFAEWLAGNPERQRQYVLCEIAWNLSLPAAQRLRASAAGKRERATAPYRRQALGMGLAAAMLVAALALWLLLGSGPQPLRYATGPGEQRTIALADGSRITLNTRTTLEVTIHRGKRDVVLEYGEAFFDVAHDPVRPFRVLTPMGQVSVVGTRFGVYQQPQALEVSTEEGLVHVSPTGAPESTSAVLVRPGESAVIATPGAQPRLRRADLERIDNWRHQRLEFDAVPLAELLEEFSRYTPAALRPGTPELGALRVSGVFHTGDLTALARTLQGAFGLVVRVSAHGELVVERGHPALTDR